MQIILLLFALPSLLVVFECIPYLIHGKRWYSNILVKILDLTCIILLPIFFLVYIDLPENDCCSESATFSPDHKLTVYSIIFLGILAYFYSSWQKRQKSPVIEVLINIFLLMGLLFNFFMSWHVQGYFFFGNLPIIILFFYKLHENHLFFLDNFKISENKLEKFAFNILSLPIIYKFPILLLLGIPVFTIIMCFLILFGQKPDSIIRSFTDTYKHGFSQMDHLCDNVHCGGHFLCSIAAKGNPDLVKPIRYGERNGNKILCNRQLLIANAFEEWIEDEFPKTHQMIRKQYNKVGNKIHKHYHFFNQRWISNLFYILMKPLELFFLFFLYTFDSKPENRIHVQYLKKMDRIQIKNLI